MKLRKIECIYCGFEGRPIKGTRGRGQAKGMTKLCPLCRGQVVDA